MVQLAMFAVVLLRFHYLDCLGFAWEFKKTEIALV